MNLIFFSHPDFLGHQSMPRYANLLSDGFQKRGHQVRILSPKARLYNLPVPRSLKKWMGYIDQYILFPIEAKRTIRRSSPDTLFVYTDHALGPWVPLTKNRHHIIHCHDFLAQRSAKDQFSQNPVSWTGKKYQNYIRNGFSRGKNFISISKATQHDLESLLKKAPSRSFVVYNGLNQEFGPGDMYSARQQLSIRTGVDLHNGFILHIGGNHWYKNRIGVVEIYNSWRDTCASSPALPLVMIGEEAGSDLEAAKRNSAFGDDVHFLTGLEDQFIRTAYKAASVFLFPSYNEGFGWPIAEAMASGCPVVTTNLEPMTEVAGGCAFLIDRKPEEAKDIHAWAVRSAITLNEAVTLSDGMRERFIKAGLENAKRFDREVMLDKVEAIYSDMVLNGKPA